MRSLLDGLPAKISVKDSESWFLEYRKDYLPLQEDLEQLGFKKAGLFELPSRRVFPLVVAGFVNESLNFDALVTEDRQDDEGVRLEIGSYNEDGVMYSVGNRQVERVLSFESSCVDCRTFEGATPKELVARLQEIIKGKSLRIKAVPPRKFPQRLEDTYERMVQELRDYLTNILNTPAIFVDERPARFERLWCHVNVVDSRNPTWCTAKVTRNCLEELEETPLDDRLLFWEMKVLAAADLLNIRHLQYVGAPRSTEFIAKGAVAAVDFCKQASAERKPFGDHCVVGIVTQGLLLNLLADDWEGFIGMCNSLKSGLTDAVFWVSDDPPRGTGEVPLGCGFALSRSRASWHEADGGGDSQVTPPTSEKTAQGLGGRFEQRCNCV